MPTVVQPSIEAEYKQARVRESLTRIRRGISTISFLVSVMTVLYIIAFGFKVIFILLTALTWLSTLGLWCTSFGKANPEEFATVLLTIGFFTLTLQTYNMHKDLHSAWNDDCNSMNITKPIIQAATEKDFSDLGHQVAVAGDYCADMYKTEAGWMFWEYFARWLVYTMCAVLLCRLRFKHCLMFAGLPGLLQMILASDFTLATGNHQTLVGLFVRLLMSYIPGLLVCLMTPRITEKLHFANFVLHRSKDSRLKQQSDKIKDQSKEIRKTKEQLAEAQKVVDDVMAQGGTVLDQYAVPYSDLTMGASLGEGSFGTVYKAKLKRGAGDTTVAVKTMRVEKVTTEIMDKFRGEICIMAPLHHPNLVRLYGAVWSEGPDKLCIVLEFVENGSLLDVLTSGQGGTWANPRFGFAHGIAKCFRYLHHELPEPLMHRDLKPANVLITSDMKSKVADFGESKQFTLKTTAMGEQSQSSDQDGLLTMTYVGTELYMAPEIHDGQRYNKSVDVFAFSLVLLEIAVGDPRYIETHFRGTRSRIPYYQGWRPPMPEVLLEQLPELVSLIEEGWDTDPSDRPEFLSIEPRLAALKPDGASSGASTVEKRGVLLSAEETEVIKNRFHGSSKKFSAFLSHHKAACAAEARLVKLQLDAILGKESFLDSDNLRDLRSLLQHVIDSDVLLLFQSKEVLHRPWCLLELYTAVTNGVPIVALNCAGKGYNFADASDFLNHLETSLQTHNPTALNVLSQHNADPFRVAHALSSVIPLIISLPLNSSSSKNMIDASLADLAKAMAGATARPLAEGSFESWLAARTAQEQEDLMAVIERGTVRRTHRGDTIRGTMRGRMLAKVEQVDKLEAEKTELKAELKAQLAEVKAEAKVQLMEAKAEAKEQVARLLSQLEKKDAMAEKLMAKVEKLEEKLGY